jgi:hypothetical protein
VSLHYTPNKENIQKWVEALRSADYEQATGALRKDDAYCCLGVACDLSGLGRWVENTELARWEYRDDDDPEDYGVGVLPGSVADWLGVGQVNPNLYAPALEGKRSAASLNDSYHYNFNQIADAVERTYLSV